jgi:hypothetical protein
MKTWRFEHCDQNEKQIKSIMQFLFTNEKMKDEKEMIV